MNNVIKCMAVDDENLALEVIETHLSRIPGTKLIHKCSNAIEAAEAIKREKPQLLFLDINMPEITGIDFMKQIENSGILVVFTTAFSEYAVDAFNLDALDYILKPISFERLQKSVERAREYIAVKESGEQPQAEMQDGHMFVKSDSKLIKINYGDILYVEAFADYVKIYTSAEKRLITLQTMKNMENGLPAELFCRVHRSYIVALNKISSIGSHELKIEDKIIPIGKNYRDGFKERLQTSNIIR